MLCIPYKYMIDTNNRGKLLYIPKIIFTPHLN